MPNGNFTASYRAGLIHLLNLMDELPPHMIKTGQLLSIRSHAEVSSSQNIQVKIKIPASTPQIIILSTDKIG